MRLSLAVSSAYSGSSGLRARALLALLIPMALWGCSSQPADTQYLIALPTEEVGSTPIDGPLIAVSDARLPIYAQGNQMLISEDRTISALDAVVWSGDLAALITDGFALRLRVNGSNAWALPLPAEGKRDGTIQLVFDELLWAPPQGVVLRGSMVLSIDGQPTRSESFFVRQGLESRDAAGYSNALGIGLSRLAESAAEWIDRS
ncbi:MAG: ABC-type transport auxiliary lipoprotein family protein [Pseudomonadota bacterium]